MQVAGGDVPTIEIKRENLVRHGALFASFVVLVTLHWSTFASLVGIWLKSDTFAHGIFIAPIALYLIYERREYIRPCRWRIDWLGLAGLLAGGALWWVGVAADLQVIQQLAAVGLIPALVVLFLGRQFAAEIAFPLGFLFVAVPFGEALTPLLIDMTADFVVSAIRASGIPVFREGNQFVIPSGRWSVISACSGMRYLMATITVALVFAYLNYQSALRRTAFVAVAIVFSIVANWLRAYGIVMIGHLSNNKLATGVDHYLYGWVFFGIIIFSLMAIGRLWQEDEQVIRSSGQRVLGENQQYSEPPIRIAIALLFGALCLQFWISLSAHFTDHSISAAIPRIDESTIPAGWTVSESPLGDWVPEFYGTTKHLKLSFRNSETEIGTFIGWYSEQGQGAEVINAKNKLVSEKNKRWRHDRLGARDVNLGELRTVNEDIMASSAQDFLVWRWYWNGGRTATTPAMAKLHQFISRISGSGGAGAEVIVYTEIPDTGPDLARTRLRTFLSAFGPRLAQSFNDAIGQ